jgi:hypothetical protein
MSSYARHVTSRVLIIRCIGAGKQAEAIIMHVSQTATALFMGVNSDGGLSHCLPLMVKALETEAEDPGRIEVSGSITVSRSGRNRLRLPSSGECSPLPAGHRDPVRR